jgi:hypothetical protein
MILWRKERPTTDGQIPVRPYHVKTPGIWKELWYIFRGRYLPPTIECKVEVAAAMQLGEFSFCGYPVLQAGFYVPCGRLATQGCAYCDLHGENHDAPQGT